MARTTAIAACIAALVTLTSPLGCAPERPTFDAETIARAQEEGDTSPTVARVGGRPLTFASFNRRLNALPPYARARYGSPDTLVDFLEAQVTMELMADAARQAGLSRAPEVVDAVKDAVAERAISTQLRARLDAAPRDGEANPEAGEARSYQDERRAAREEAVAALVERAEITVDEGALKRLRWPSSPAAPPPPNP